MGRSLKKGPYTDAKLLEKVQRSATRGDRKPIKTWSRRSTITPEFVGLTFAIHNGKTFLSAFVITKDEPKGRQPCETSGRTRA